MLRKSWIKTIMYDNNFFKSAMLLFLFALNTHGKRCPLKSSLRNFRILEYKIILFIYLWVCNRLRLSTTKLTPEHISIKKKKQFIPISLTHLPINCPNVESFRTLHRRYCILKSKPFNPSSLLANDSPTVTIINFLYDSNYIDDI